MIWKPYPILQKDCLLEVTNEFPFRSETGLLACRIPNQPTPQPYPPVSNSSLCPLSESQASRFSLGLRLFSSDRFPLGDATSTGAEVCQYPQLRGPGSRCLPRGLYSHVTEQGTHLYPSPWGFPEGKLRWVTSACIQHGACSLHTFHRNSPKPPTSLRLRYWVMIPSNGVPGPVLEVTWSAWSRAWGERPSLGRFLHVCLRARQTRPLLCWTLPQPLPAHATPAGCRPQLARLFRAFFYREEPRTMQTCSASCGIVS